MRYAVTQITPPAVEPISLAQAKAHLRVDISDDDAYITALIIAARQYAENYTKRVFITQTWNLLVDDFSMYRNGLFFLPSSITPWTQELVIPKAPLQSIVSINYLNTAGVSTTLDPSLYTVDTSSLPGRLYPSYGQIWPSTQAFPHAVTIQFIAGYGLAAAVPNTIVQALLLLVSHWYENREPIVAERGVVPAELPLAVDALLGVEQVIEFA